MTITEDSGEDMDSEGEYDHYEDSGEECGGHGRSRRSYSASVQIAL